MKQTTSVLMNKAKKIRVFLMDVDGVLTGGQIIILRSGEEVKIWNVKDRFAFMIAGSMKNIITGWISGRGSAEIRKRARELNIDELFVNQSDKTKALESVIKKYRLKPESVLYIGDDILDLTLFPMVGLSVCPRDAASDVRKEADFITKAKGGEGVFREVLELILRTQGKWKQVVKGYAAR